MKRSLLLSSLLFTALLAAGQDKSAGQGVVRPGENLVVENVPSIPASVAEKSDQYGEFRAATLADWHPSKREMLIGTRFADVPQIHSLKTPGGARTQLTFFRDRVQTALYQPKVGG